VATTLDAEAIAHVLTTVLPACQEEGARVLRCRVTPLRYRPGKRCTVRFDLWLRSARAGSIRPQTIFGKLYHNAAKASAVYAEMQMLANSTLVETGQVVLARPIAFLPELSLILQEPVNGVPLDLLLSHPKRMLTSDPRARNGVGRAATALAALHNVELCSGRERPIDAELAKYKRRAAGVAHVDAALGAHLGELVVMLSSGMTQLAAWGAEVRLIHGDCKPSQFLVGAPDIALLDFDHCGMADPAVDVGAFLATLRQLNVFHTLKTGSKDLSLYYLLEQLFLKEYLSARGCPSDFQWRANWYAAVALLRKALRAFARSDRSPVPAALVEQAWRYLGMTT
jgi:hypothetical protein